MNQNVPFDDQNPYATPSEIHVYPDSIEFNGIVTREAYTKLLPKKTLYLFLVLAFLLLGVALPVLIAASFFAIFVTGDAGTIIGTVLITLLTCVAMGFCIWMASSRLRANSYLKKFPDLIGPLKGTFSAAGLLISDEEKKHWIPWVQLSHLVVTKIGVRVPLGEDPRRFVALAPELFASYHPEDLEAMRVKNRTLKTTYDQLIAESAVVFKTDVQAAGFYSGLFQQPASFKTWTRILIGPASVCIYIGFHSLLRRWNWITICLAVFLSFQVVPSLWKFVELLRKGHHSTEMGWGWLSETELIYGLGLHVMRIPIASMNTIGCTDGILHFQLASGNSLFVHRALFPDPTCFDIFAMRRTPDE